MSTAIHEDFKGMIGDSTVVTAYRAFGEPTQPFCLWVHEIPDLSLTFQPPQIDDYEDEDEFAEAVDRQRGVVIGWVRELTSLLQDRRELRVLKEHAEHIHVAEPVSNHPAFEVDSLGVYEQGEVWEDCDGDYYRWVGVWQFSEDEGGSWKKLNDLALLDEYGPYRSVAERVDVVNDPAEYREHVKVGEEWIGGTDLGQGLIYKLRDSGGVVYSVGDEDSFVHEVVAGVDGIALYPLTRVIK